MNSGCVLFHLVTGFSVTGNSKKDDPGGSIRGSKGLILDSFFSFFYSSVPNK